MKENGKISSVKRSVAFMPETIKQLDAMAAKQHVPTSVLIRRFVDQGMSIEKTKDDIDFIRKHIREEVEATLSKPLERIIKLHIKTGLMSVAMCFFTRDILFGYVKEQGGITKEEMLQYTTKMAHAYLRAGSEDLDEAFRRYDGEEDI